MTQPQMSVAPTLRNRNRGVDWGPGGGASADTASERGGRSAQRSVITLQGEVKAGLEWVQERLEDSLESVHCMGEGGGLETGRE